MTVWSLFVPLAPFTMNSRTLPPPGEDHGTWQCKSATLLGGTPLDTNTNADPLQCLLMHNLESSGQSWDLLGQGTALSAGACFDF
jgi:hypothetical protein